MSTQGQDEAKHHAWHISSREYFRHFSRRGKVHAFQKIVPKQTALIVVDMVSFFVDANPYCRGIVPNINSLAETLRMAGGTVAWVLPAEESDVSNVKREFYGPAVAAMYNKSGGSGTLPERLWHGLDVSPDDLLVEKRAASAFFPGYSPLPGLLEERQVDTVLIVGTVTNVCCEASARDASTLGYRVIMVADANAGNRDASHNATLLTVYRSFGDVRSTSDVLGLINSSPT